MAVASSLFDAPPSQVLPPATDWLANLLLGSLATGICVLAVAFIGFRLMTGDMAIRAGLRVVLGCFVLLGAPFVASGLRSVAGQSEPSTRAAAVVTPRPELPTPPYDPYAGASLRQDWEGMQPDPFRPRLQD